MPMAQIAGLEEHGEEEATRRAMEGLIKRAVAQLQYL
jgi:hypothetical protein